GRGGAVEVDFCYQGTTLRPRAENAESRHTGGRANTLSRSTPGAAVQPLRGFRPMGRARWGSSRPPSPKSFGHKAILHPPAVAKSRFTRERPRQPRTAARSGDDLSLRAAARVRGGRQSAVFVSSGQTIRRARLLPGLRAGVFVAGVADEKTHQWRRDRVDRKLGGILCR